MSYYWVNSLTSASPTAAFDAIELVEPGTGLLKIWRAHVWQTTDLGDTAEEVLRVEWMNGFTVSGSSGQTTAIKALNSSDSTATFTAELLNTSLATTSGLALEVRGWNIRQTLDMLYPPEQVLVLRNGERMVLRVSAPTDAITVCASCLVEQL